MPRIVKFPKGFNVTLVDKKDILQTIDANIVDKEVIKEIIDNLEADATNFIKEDVWASIPFLGSIRGSQLRKVLNQDDVKDLMTEARDNLDEEKYLLFRRNLTKDISKRIRNTRFYRYTTSININLHKSYYRRIKRIYGASMARFIIFSVSQLNVKNSESITYEER